MKGIKLFTILFISLFAFSLHIIANKDAIPMEGELKAAGVRSVINMTSVEVSFDQDFLYLDFNQLFPSVTVLIINDNNNILINDLYANPQSEAIPLDSLSSGSYRIELHANGRAMWGWFYIP